MTSLASMINDGIGVFLIQRIDAFSIKHFVPPFRFEWVKGLNEGRRGAAAHSEEVPGTTKSAHTGIKACMGASVRFSMEIVGGCRRA